jgi:hypothetical protein
VGAAGELGGVERTPRRKAGEICTITLPWHNIHYQKNLEPSYYTKLVGFKKFEFQNMEKYKNLLNIDHVVYLVNIKIIVNKDRKSDIRI